MDQATSSKVTVEYFDPYNVFQLISPGLLPRLPLRNLHWESHAGPLRSIQTLHVDLVPARASRAAPVSRGSELSKVKNNETKDGDEVQSQNLTSVIISTSREGKIRRHQIPGLHQTPYLKLLFLRCDDNETYKASTRKEVREWLKEHVPPADSSAKEGHDAFEWLIVHVVVPNTAASTQPKTASKGPTPLLEKLKNDFNGASKHSTDRIAQIRIGINDVPYNILPRVVPAIPGSYNETPKEHQESWIDLVAKLKALILAAFDMRVSQYEENIKEKDGQRSLPGWNFCTFFMLKESLARGFESVGLIEDALTAYDELSLMLEAFCCEQASTKSEVAFLPYTDDLRHTITTCKASIMETNSSEALTASANSSSDHRLADEMIREIPLSANRKSYRDLVLANDISIFDFRCYMFARQLSLLLRLANATVSDDQLLVRLKEQQAYMTTGLAPRIGSPQIAQHDVEDLELLSQICQRALEFMTSITQVMRRDMNTIFIHDDGSDIFATAVTHKVIDNIVASFIFSVAQQILASTSIRSLSVSLSHNALNHDVAYESVDNMSEPKTVSYPFRSTSLMAKPMHERITISPSITPSVKGIRTASAQGSRSADLSVQTTKIGFGDLVVHRAELYLFSRSFLQDLGTAQGWLLGSDMLESSSQMQEVPLDDSFDNSQIAGNSPMRLIISSQGILDPSLAIALSSEIAFHQVYERLTNSAISHFSIAGHKQSLQSAVAELASLKYYLREYSSAASYFQSYCKTSFYEDQGWEHIEVNMLMMYSESLKSLGRFEEYTKVVLKLLSTVAAHEQERIKSKSQFDIERYGDNISQDSNTSRGHLPALLETLKHLKQNAIIPLSNLFAMVEVGDSIIYHDYKDSFELNLKFRYLLLDELPVNMVKVRLVPIYEGQAKDIWLENSGHCIFKKGVNEVLVTSNTVILGTYAVQEVVLVSGNLTLSHLEDEATTKLRTRGREFLHSTRLQILQRPNSIDVRLSPSRTVHLRQSQALELLVSSGWNDILSAELQIRAATAGMRLKTKEFSTSFKAKSTVQYQEAGVMKIDNISAHETICLLIPFSVEADVPEISVKCEICYTTSAGTFSFLTQLHMSCKLPLGVSVIDIFKEDALFSKFSIIGDTSVPLFIIGSELEDSDAFKVNDGGNLNRVIAVYENQPAVLLYKINRDTMAKSVAKEALSLRVSYALMTERIEEAISAEILSKLNGADLAQYTKFITKIIVHEVILKSTTAIYERMALLGEISTDVVKGVRWLSYFQGLGKHKDTNVDVAIVLEQWLEHWLNMTRRIPLLPIEINEETLRVARNINIPVAIPSVTVVYTADLVLNGPMVSHAKGSSLKTATKNQVIPAILTINSTRAWDATSNYTDGVADTDSLQFYYELTAPGEHYLLGGKRKGHFYIPTSTSVPTTSLSFSISIIPVKEGFLPFPQLEIRPIQPIIRPKSKGSTSSGKQGIGEELVTCEVDYKAKGDMVRVVNGNVKSTFSLDASGPQGGAWLVGYEKAA